MEDREFSYINVIPLVDIMLVLLTIVLTTATFIVQGEIPINLPSAENPEERKTKQAIDITINKKGEIFLKGRKLSLKDLAKELRAVNRKRQVNLRVDKDVRVQNFVSILDLLNRLRFENVSLIVKKHGD